MSALLRDCYSLVRCCCIAAVAWAAFTTHAPLALGQAAQMSTGLKPDGKTPVDVANLLTNPRLASQLRGIVIPILQQGKANTQQETDNVDLWTVFRIAQLTLPPTDVKDTVEIRRSNMKTREILRLTGGASIPQDLHDRANTLMLVNLPQLIGNSQYAMEARYNAMLLLGMLDKVEPDAANLRPAVPLDAAEPLLLQAAQSATLPEILRIGALIGLARHCELQLAAVNRPAIAAEALTLLAAKAPPAGFSPNGFHWARKQALQMVIGLSKGSEVSRPEFVQALHALLADETQPLFLRRDAALAFGYIDPAAVAGGAVKPAELCKAMANFTLAVTKAGSPRFDPTAPTDLAKPEDVLPTPNEDNKIQFAQGVAYYLNCIATGLGGRGTNRGLLKAIPGSDPAFALVNTLLNTHVNPLVTAMTAPKPDSNRLVAALTSGRPHLEQWFQQNMQGPAGATPTTGGGVPVGAGGALAAPVAPK